MKYDLSDYDVALIILALRKENYSNKAKDEALRLARHLVYLALNNPELEPFD